MERESMKVDVLIVGGGPAGLAAAIRLKQLDESLHICLLEKGAEIGAHILSGCVFEPRALDELLPNWREQDFPITLEANSDEFLYLTEQKSYRLPNPPTMKNHGNYIISLSQLCRKLAEIAESLGIEIYPGFAAHQVKFNDDNEVVGVITGDMGVNKDGSPGPNYQPGMELLAPITLFAEGCRGSLSKQLITHYQLDKDKSPQSYGLGLKEIWRIKESEPGKITHTIGWPLDSKTYGGSFIYHLEDNKIAVGFVVGLDYKNPYLSPFSEFQRFKTHPKIAPLFEGGERLSYGARALNEGGVQATPHLSFPGGALIGDSAGFLNVAKIKGSHTAMKSGMLAAEAVIETLKEKKNQPCYQKTFEHSWVHQELHQVRNVRPGFHYGLWLGLAYAAIDQYLLRGKAPWTFAYNPDHESLDKAATAKKIDYPKPDGKLTFDRASSLYLSGTFHEEEQPCHLTLKDKSVAIDVNYKDYDSPETRYCPAGVYEIVMDNEDKPRLQINAQNCLHCKTCDIKDITQNINWLTPEGSGGPQYSDM